MARNYEKELADAEAKVKRIKQQKAAAERRKYEPVGRAMYAVFSAELVGLNGQKETKAFCRELRELYDKTHPAGAQTVAPDVVSSTEATPSATDMPVRFDDEPVE